VRGQLVSDSYFSMLGARMTLGRGFLPEEDRSPGTHPVAVLSHRFWKERFGGDSGVVGRAATINGRAYTIVGVAPERFNGVDHAEARSIWVPLAMAGTSAQSQPGLLSQRGTWWLRVVGRLQPGVSVAAANAAVATQAARTRSVDTTDVETMSARVVPVRSGMSPNDMNDVYPVATLAGGVTLLVLLIACANVSNLLLGRAVARRREIAVRLALGAGRGRILRQLVTEALLISFLGGVLGLVGSVALLRALLDWNPFPQFPLRIPVTPDASIVVLALLMSIATGFAFGAIPVRQVFRTEPYEVIKTGGLSGVLQRTRLRDLLLVAQIAICALLVTSSFVAVRGLARSLHGDFGFEPRGTLIAQTGLGMAGYHGDAVLPMQKRLLESLASLPGVTAVASTDWAPLTTGDANGERIYKESETDLRPGGGTPVLVMKVSPGYLAAARTHLVAGRDLDWHDDTTATRVALVNRTFAREQFGSEASALGRSFRRRDASLVQVVGIVEDGKYENLSEAPQPTMFLPLAQAGTGEMDILVRGTGDPQALAEAVRVRMRTVDPALPCFLQSYDSALNLALFPARVAGVALGILGVIAAVLSITGIFGLAAYAVSRRMREFGIRIALGAEPRDVLRAALARPFRLLGYGSLAGVVLGLLASRVLGSIVYQANPRDPVVLAGAVLVMFLLGLLATWIPAKRALSVNPLVLLREE
jgi:predicted permease